MAAYSLSFWVDLSNASLQRSCNSHLSNFIALLFMNVREEYSGNSYILTSMFVWLQKPSIYPSFHPSPQCSSSNIVHQQLSRAAAACVRRHLFTCRCFQILLLSFFFKDGSSCLVSLLPQIPHPSVFMSSSPKTNRRLSPNVNCREISIMVPIINPAMLTA